MIVDKINSDLSKMNLTFKKKKPYEIFSTVYQFLNTFDPSLERIVHNEFEDREIVKYKNREEMFIIMDTGEDRRSILKVFDNDLLESCPVILKLEQVGSLIENGEEFKYYKLFSNVK